ncbi:MAG: transposase [Myxococcota bacterium]
MIGRSWRERWDHVTPFLAFPAEVRRAIYTTNAIESLHRTLCKSLKTRGSLPHDEAALKLWYLSIRSAKKWGTRVTRGDKRDCSSPFTSGTDSPHDD